MAGTLLHPHKIKKGSIMRTVEHESETVNQRTKEDHRRNPWHQRYLKHQYYYSGNMMKKVGLIMSISLVVLVIAIMAYLICISPGKPIPVRGRDGKTIEGSLSEKINININGISQGMFIKSANTDNPVLLFLHGGPGMPEYFLTRNYPTGLEEDFHCLLVGPTGSRIIL